MEQTLFSVTGVMGFSSLTRIVGESGGWESSRRDDDAHMEKLTLFALPVSIPTSYSFGTPIHIN